MKELRNLIIFAVINTGMPMGQVVFGSIDVTNSRRDVRVGAGSMKPKLLSGSWAGKVKSDQVALCNLSLSIDYLETYVVIGNRRLECGAVVYEFASITLEKNPEGKLFLDGEYMGDWFENFTGVDIDIRGGNLGANQFIDAVISYNSLQDKITYYDEEHINFTTGLHKYVMTVNGFRRSLN